MKNTGKIVAWVCIICTLLMGCYNSVMLKPDEREKINTREIKSVVAKDSTKYEFDNPPTVVNDTIVGEVVLGWKWVGPHTKQDSTKQISIPMSDVVEVYVSEISASRTGVLIVGGGAIVCFGAVLWLVYSAIRG